MPNPASLQKLIVKPLRMPWETLDPFLFCVHHDDKYPAGNALMGPEVSLSGRDLGQDFGGRDGWSMYHGTTVPGFPQHPHRGFETVTLVRKGLIDHSDSLGATARFGGGDVQWLTAGKGIVHCEMFPLLSTAKANPLELFQIWLNLPGEHKMVDPHFSMLWADTIPTDVVTDAAGKKTHVTILAGALGKVRGPKPPPKSWASRPDGDVAIWTIAMEPGAKFTVPASAPGSNRILFFFEGETIEVAGQMSVPVKMSIRPIADQPLELINGPVRGELLMLQGRPIGEPVVAMGPFVMNTEAEVRQAFADYRRTQFGGWPWRSDDPVHPRTAQRFAKHADGKVEAERKIVPG